MSTNDKLLRATSRGATWATQLILHGAALAIFSVIVVYIVIRELIGLPFHALSSLRQQKPPSLQQLRSPRQWAASTRTLVAVFIALCALALWCFSLQWVDVSGMNDLGLVSVLPIPCVIALGCLTLGFCLILSAIEGVRPIVLLLYLLVLICMLYATPALVEQAPRFPVTYWLAGHTEFILRNGSVNPYLDAYFNWPGFFVLTGLLTSMTGLHTVLAFAPWASFAYNLLYLAPMYLIFKSATNDRRTIWLGLWFFYVTDWVWQDYFDPQGLNFFFYLVIIAIVLKGFQTAREMPEHDWAASARRVSALARQVRNPREAIANLGAWSRDTLGRVKTIRPAKIRASWVNRGSFPGHLHLLRQWAALSDVQITREQRRKRIALLLTLITIFALSVFSHPITPFFVLLSVTALTIFGKITPRWLPILLAAMILGWDFTAATPYMMGHLRADMASFGNIQVVASTNVTDRLAAGNPEHQFVSQVRILVTAAIWGLAILGAYMRWRGSSIWAVSGAKWDRGSLFSHDVPFLLLAVAPVFLVVAQPYGGEMAMRYYLFTLPIVSFFAATAFRTRVTFHKGIVGKLSRWFASRSAPVNATAVVVACLLLLGGFMFARYGNENADYVTYNEANAVAYLYHVAPPHSLLLQGWTGTPWKYQDLDLYVYSQLYTGHGKAVALQTHDIAGILDTASSVRYPAVYVILSRSQKAQAQLFAGVSPAAFEGVEDALLESGRFELIYSNSDADILVYVHPHSVGALPNHSYTAHQIPRGIS